MNIHWVQWGRRNNFIGPKALSIKYNVTAHIAYHKKIFELNSDLSLNYYKLDFILQHLNAKYFKDSLDFGTGLFLNRFHKAVLKKVHANDMIYTISNGLPIIESVDCLFKVHEQVSCTLDLALIKNNIEKKNIDLEVLEERERRTFNNVDVVVCPSEYVEQYVKKIAPNVKTKLIRYPIPNLSFYNRILKVENKRLKFIYVGRVESSKGVDLIFKLAKNFKDIDFLLVGDILCDLPKLNNLKCFGKLSHAEMFPLLRSSDLFLFPSLSEGSAFASLEAYSLELPALISCQSGSHYVDNFTGFVLDCNAHSEWFSKVNTILLDPEILTQFKTNIKMSDVWNIDKYNDSIEGLFNGS